MKAIGVIPSRLGSTRLARKPLALIAGVPMIVRVYRGASGAAGLADLVVATDSEEIASLCRSERIPFEMTSADHVSGTDRIREVASRRDGDVFVNIQGDEPMVSAKHVEALLAPFARGDEVAITTLAVPLAEGASDPAKVKVVVRRDGRALYFSRAAIPFDRDGAGVARWKHLGFYAYRRAALEAFGVMPPSELEQAERLEQLRFLENSFDIHVAEAPFDTLSVDTAEDLAALEAVFSGR